MEVVLIALVAALATTAALVVVPAAVARVRTWRDERDRAYRTLAVHAPAVPSPDDDEPQVRSAPPGDAVGLVDWVRVGEVAALVRGDGSTRSREVRPRDELDVQGHGSGLEYKFDDTNIDDEDVDPATKARTTYWRTDGSTDCPDCASSRARGARFCLRCGRRLR